MWSSGPLAQVAQGQLNIAFQKDVDPDGVLANMVVSNAMHSYIHTDDNQVQCFTTFKGVGSERRQVQHYISHSLT